MSKASKGFESRGTTRAYTANARGAWQRQMNENGSFESQQAPISVRSKALERIDVSLTKHINEFEFGELGTFPEDRLHLFEASVYTEYSAVESDLGSWTKNTTTTGYYLDAILFFKQQITPLVNRLGAKVKPVFVYSTAGFKFAGVNNPMPLPGMVRNNSLNSWQTMGLLFKSASQNMMFKLAWDDGNKEPGTL